MPATATFDHPLQPALAPRPGRFERFLEWLLPDAEKKEKPVPAVSLAAALAVAGPADPLLLAAWLEAEDASLPSSLPE